jgi:hypothetical protein
MLLVEILYNIISFRNKYIVKNNNKNEKKYTLRKLIESTLPKFDTSNSSIKFRNYILYLSKVKQFELINFKSSLNPITFSSFNNLIFTTEIVSLNGISNISAITLYNPNENIPIKCKSITIYYVNELLHLESKRLSYFKGVIDDADNSLYHSNDTDNDMYIYFDEVCVSKLRDLYNIHYILFELDLADLSPVIISITRNNMSYVFLSYVQTGISTIKCVNDLDNKCGYDIIGLSYTNIIFNRLQSNIENNLIFIDYPIKEIDGSIPEINNGIDNIANIIISYDRYSNIQFNEIGIYYVDKRYGNSIIYNTLNIKDHYGNNREYPIHIDDADDKVLVSTNLNYSNYKIFIIKINVHSVYKINNEFKLTFKCKTGTYIFNICCNKNIFIIALKESDILKYMSHSSAITYPSNNSLCSKLKEGIAYANIKIIKNIPDSYSVSFTDTNFYIIEGTCPEYYGLDIGVIEFYSNEDENKLEYNNKKQHDITIYDLYIYYTDKSSNELISKKILLFNINYGFTSVKEYVLNNTNNKVVRTDQLPSNTYVYRISFKTKTTYPYPIQIKLITRSGDYHILTCVGTNSCYLDISGYSSNPIYEDYDQSVFDNMSLKLTDAINYNPVNYNSINIGLPRYSKDDITDDNVYATSNFIVDIDSISIETADSYVDNAYIAIYYTDVKSNTMKYMELKRYIDNNFIEGNAHIVYNSITIIDYLLKYLNIYKIFLKFNMPSTFKYYLVINDIYQKSYKFLLNGVGNTMIGIICSGFYTNKKIIESNVIDDIEFYKDHIAEVNISTIKSSNNINILNYYYSDTITYGKRGIIDPLAIKITDVNELVNITNIILTYYENTVHTKFFVKLLITDDEESIILPNILHPFKNYIVSLKSDNINPLVSISIIGNNNKNIPIVIRFTTRDPLKYYYYNMLVGSAASYINFI